ncbi:MAG: class I SAM-dependent methyltransferase [Candidatus Bathyarchaeota archaeon]|nr:class I SAM-dependent methyltransferase [Candidatus Bathyarchaeota archaeon]
MSVGEVEGLGYYDFMAYIGVPFFNIGGVPSLDLLAERCGIDETCHVLDVGCGTGGNSAYLVESYGCRVTGIDISEIMIARAQERKEEHPLGDRMRFMTGDAYALGFPDESFDVVLTVFVSQFLDIEQAFSEFSRVLAPGGCLGVNEMYRLESVPGELVERVDEAEQVFRELTELPFSLRSPEVWERGFRDAGFVDVGVEAFEYAMDVRAGLEMVEDMGGWWKMLGMLWKTYMLALRSRKIREKYMRIGRGKDVMLRDKETKKYFGYVLGLGKKP